MGFESFFKINYFIIKYEKIYSIQIENILPIYFFTFDYIGSKFFGNINPDGGMNKLFII